MQIVIDYWSTLKDILYTFPRGYFLKFMVGVRRPVLQILTLFQTKKCYFPHPFSDLAFRPKLCHHYQIREETKKFFKCVWIRTFLLRSYSFGIATINMFIHSRSSLVNHTRFQTKIGNRRCIPVFTPKRPKTLPVGAANTYMAYRKEYPPPPGVYVYPSRIFVFVQK